MLDIKILHKDISKPHVFKKPAMVMAHFNPEELNMMDHLQGGEKRNSAGVRTYDKLWHGLIKHGPIKEAFLEHARIHNANGGAIQAKIRNMKRHGRFGDSEIGCIPSGLAEVFDHAIGGRVHNPYDGHPEYFELTPKLAPLMNMFKNGASNVKNYLKTVPVTALMSAKRAASLMSNRFNRSRNNSSMMPGIAQQPAGQQVTPQQSTAPATSAQPQSWRNWAESGTRQTIAQPLERGMRVAGGVLGGYAGNRTGNSVASAIPLPSSLVVAPATAYGAYRGQRTGRQVGQSLTNALATGAGHVGGGIDYLNSIPAVRNTASSAVEGWNRYNPVGQAYRALGSERFTPRMSPIPEAVPGQNNRLPTGAVIDDVD